MNHREVNVILKTDTVIPFKDDVKTCYEGFLVLIEDSVLKPKTLPEFIYTVDFLNMKIFYLFTHNI